MQHRDKTLQSDTIIRLIKNKNLSGQVKRQ